MITDRCLHADAPLCLLNLGRSYQRAYIIVCFIGNNVIGNKHFRTSVISFCFLLAYQIAEIRGANMTYSNIE